MLLLMSGTPCRGDRRQHIGIHERKVYLLYGDTFGGVLLFRAVFPVVLWNLFIVFYHDICKFQTECRGGRLNLALRELSENEYS